MYQRTLNTSVRQRTATLLVLIALASALAAVPANAMASSTREGSWRIGNCYFDGLSAVEGIHIEARTREDSGNCTAVKASIVYFNGTYWTSKSATTTQRTAFVELNGAADFSHSAHYIKTPGSSWQGPKRLYH